MNWYLFAVQLAISFLSIPAVSILAYYIVKASIDASFKARVLAYEHELKLISQRDNIRFSTLHADRARVIKELYDKLIDFNNSGSMHMIVPKNEGFKQIFIKCFLELTTYYPRHKIYFSEKVCELIEKISLEMQLAVSDQYVLLEREKKGELLQKEDLEKKWGVIRSVLPALFKQLETEFRQLLGVDDK